jgi:hypothetical protein
MEISKTIASLIKRANQTMLTLISKFIVGSREVPMSSLYETMEQLSKQRVEQMSAKNQFIRRAWEWLLQLVSPGPRNEIHHAWLTVFAFAKRATEAVISEESIGTEQHVDREKLHILSILQACLQLARRERDFAQAWSYINLADTLLPLIVKENELDAATTRLSMCDGFLPSKLKFALHKYLDALKASEKNSSRAKKVRSDSQRKSQIEQKRYSIQAAQTARALCWNVVNRRITLKLALWRSLESWLLLALVATMVVAEIQYGRSNVDKSLFSLPFATTALLGFFGGGLSAFLKARTRVVKIRSFELIKVHTVLRMLVGAAGAFVIYIVAQWLPIDAISDLLVKDPYVFLAVGIAAGFSERLFVGALEKIAENLDISGVEEESTGG